MRVDLIDGWVDLASGEVHRWTPTRLTKNERRLLGYLVARAPEICSVETLLREVWGYNAQVKSRAVASTVHRMRTKLEIDPKEPVHLVTVYGAGFRFVPCGHEAAEEEIFWGREEILDHLVRAKGCQMIVGWGGAGKTRLAREVLAHRSGVFCDLGAVRTVPGALSQVAWSLGVQPEKDLAAQLGEVLRHRGLVVLDNLEQIPNFEPVVGGWAHASGVQLLLTSRTPFESEAIQVHRLGPLEPEASRGLLRSQRVRMEDAELDVVAQLLDGNPLAFQLAAPRLRLGASLGSNLREELDRGPGRRESIQGVVQWSLGLLSAKEVAAAVQIAALPAQPLPVAMLECLVGFETLERLCDGSLLAADTVPGWVRMPLLVRTVLADGGSVQQAARWCLDACERMQLHRVNEDPAIEHHLALLFALRNLVVSQPLRRQMTLAVLVGLYQRGRLELCAALLAAELDVEGVPMPERGRLLVWQARVFRRTGDVQAGIDTLRRELDATWPEAVAFDAWHALASSHVHRNEPVLALEAVRRALALHASATEAERALLSICHAQALELEGQGHRAYDLVLESWETLSQSTSYDRIVALNSLGNMAIRIDRLRTGRTWLLSALDIALARRDAVGAAVANNLGSCELALGQITEAETHFAQSAQLHREVGQRRGEAFATFNLGRTHMLRRRWDEAAPVLERAALLFQRAEVYRMSAWTQAFVAMALAELGEIAAAEHALQKVGMHDAVVQLAEAHLQRARGESVTLPTDYTPELAPHVEAFAHN